MSCKTLHNESFKKTLLTSFESNDAFIFFYANELIHVKLRSFLLNSLVNEMFFFIHEMFFGMKIIQRDNEMKIKKVNKELIVNVPFAFKMRLIVGNIRQTYKNVKTLPGWSFAFQEGPLWGKIQLKCDETCNRYKFPIKHKQKLFRKACKIMQVAAKPFN